MKREIKFRALTNCYLIINIKKRNMATLTFTPRTTIDANIFQYRLDKSAFHAQWNMRTGAYEFQEEEENIDELEEKLSLSITYDINGYFELEN